MLYSCVWLGQHGQDRRNRCSPRFRVVRRLKTYSFQLGKDGATDHRRTKARQPVTWDRLYPSQKNGFKPQIAEPDLQVESFRPTERPMTILWRLFDNVKSQRSRIKIAGSTDIARRAGTQVAKIPNSDRARITPDKTTGSRGVA
jgi:hypothetical protein